LPYQHVRVVPNTESTLCLYFLLYACYTQVEKLRVALYGGFIVSMKSVKLMQLGIVIMIFGIGLAVAISPTIFSNAAPLYLLRLLPALETIIILIGLLLGIIGYVQKER
jgi:hypothetical protein